MRDGRVGVVGMVGMVGVVGGVMSGGMVRVRPVRYAGSRVEVGVRAVGVVVAMVHELRRGRHGAGRGEAWQVGGRGALVGRGRQVERRVGASRV